MRLGLELIDITCSNVPDSVPVFIRISGTDWHAAGEKDSQGNYISWGIEQSRVFLQEASKRGISMMDVSSGGLDADQKITVGACLCLFIVKSSALTRAGGQDRVIKFLWRNNYARA
jgi:2,4-dienoyl-CoA reductase-like NADH-dependent reductase (Old Yellow Enzyme family)